MAKGPIRQSQTAPEFGAQTEISVQLTLEMIGVLLRVLEDAPLGVGFRPYSALLQQRDVALLEMGRQRFAPTAPAEE